MGLFSKIFGKKKIDAPTLEVPRTHLAFILLEKEDLPNENEILKSFKKYSQGNHLITITKDEENPTAINEQKNSLALNIEGVGFAFVALMPAAIPNREAEAAFEFSASSISNKNELKNHIAHLIVTLMVTESATPLAALMEFTNLLAAVSETTANVGVYWGNAGATHTKDFFLSIAQEKDINSRVLLWNGFSRASEAGNKISYLSYGMNQLGLPDLYLVCESKDAEVMFGRFFDLLSYIAKRGKSIPAGDTIGATEDEKILVKYIKSPVGNGKTVWKVTF